MTTIKDQSFTFPEVRVVEASAGSGKTYTLAKRYIQLLLYPTRAGQPAGMTLPMRHILAITFTNKAAFEMKFRILEFLKKIALNQLSSQEEEILLKPIGLDRQKASQQAYALMEGLIKNYNFFQVQTIDKFINALLSGCAFKIGLTANFRIKTNSLEYLEHSLDDLIDRAPSDKVLGKIFQQFLHNYLYLENRTGWFPKKDILLILRTLFGKNNAYGCRFKEGPYSPEELVKKKRMILEKINELNSQLPEGVHKSFQRDLGIFLEKSQRGFDIDSLPEYFKREELPVRKDTDVPASTAKLWTQIRKGVRELCEEEAYSLFNPYIGIYNEVREGFKKLSAKDDVLFLEELNHKARELFDEDFVTVEELYYRLATRFHHYLIDEFQDTSRLQWQNMEKMTEEALSTGGSLFYVGDRKQAIYGFRGGDVALFEEIKTKFQPFNVAIEFLANNFRSHRHVVEFNNHVFAPENLERFIKEKEGHETSKKKSNQVIFSGGEIEQIVDAFKGSKQSYTASKTGGYVKAEYVDIDKKEERNEYIRQQVVALIRDVKKRYALRDIAILTRSNSEIEEVTGWLLEEGVAVESERTSNIKENALIKELIALLKFLDSPIDNLSFAQFILGDIFAAATGRPTDEFHRFIFSLNKRRETEKDLYLYTAFREKYPELWEKYIEEFFKNIGLYPLYELVISLYHKLGCLENFPSCQGFLMHFLELIKDAEEEHTDAASFVDYFENELEGEDLYVHVTDSDTVKLLTFHKSKGLEFPVVIIPFLGMDVQVGSQGGDQKQSYILHWNEEAGCQGDIELLRLKSKYYSFSDGLYALYREEYLKAFCVELNSIYVALTRPQQELYIYIPKKAGQSFNLVKFLIPEDKYESGTKQQYEQPAAKEQHFLALPPAKYQDWIGYLRDEFPVEDELFNRAGRQQGERIHYLLSLIGDLSGQKIEDAIARSLTQGKVYFPDVTDWDDHSLMLHRILSHVPLKKFFYPEKAEVFTEKELVLRNGHTKRVDRIIIGASGVWVLDYKSSLDPSGQDVIQVKEYVQVLAELYPKRKVQGHLVYLDRLEIKDVNAD